MKLAMSNIAWDVAEDEVVARILRDNGFHGVEIAPTKVWSDPISVSPQDADALRFAWKERGLPIIAMQSLLYGREDLILFGADDERAALFDYLVRIIELGARLGTERLVFGSPKNRRVGLWKSSRAEHVAVEFFGKVGEAARRRGVVLCLEPNPVAYGCDFVTHAQAGLELVQRVANPGFGLHLDTACMTLAEDALASSIKAGAPVLCHFHASEPGLGPVVPRSSIVAHGEAAAALRAVGYSGFVSVEMRPAESAERLTVIADAAAFIAREYGNGGG